MLGHLFALSQSAAAAPSPVMGGMPPGEGMPGGPMPPGFFQVSPDPSLEYVFIYLIIIIFCLVSRFVFELLLSLVLLIEQNRRKGSLCTHACKHAGVAWPFSPNGEIERCCTFCKSISHED